jgi:hypothetical protein
MIEFQGNMLVLNNVFSKEDVEQINAYTEHIRNQERERFARIANTMLDDKTAEDVVFLINDVNVL